MILIVQKIVNCYLVARGIKLWWWGGGGQKFGGGESTAAGIFPGGDGNEQIFS